MAERLPEPGQQPERDEQQQRDLERLAARPETNREQIEADQARAETQRERAEHKLERLNSTPERADKQRQPERPERDQPKAETKERQPAGNNRRERQQAWHHEIRQIRQQLPPAARALSKVVHNPVVETVSETLEETLFRPSLVLGGAIGALICGAVLYGFAKLRGYPASGGIWLIGLVVGAVIGALVEFILYLWQRGRHQPAERPKTVRRK